MSTPPVSSWSITSSFAGLTHKTLPSSATGQPMLSRRAAMRRTCATFVAAGMETLDPFNSAARSPTGFPTVIQAPAVARFSAAFQRVFPCFWAIADNAGYHVQPAMEPGKRVAQVLLVRMGDG